MSLFYQVDYSVGSSGKRVSVTKRRVRWRWGMINKDAFATGTKGIQCNSDDHEVALTWSLTSGKRLVLHDGKEVHYSTGKRTEGKFQYSWTSPGSGNDVFTIIAFAINPIKSKPGFKQFDLLINSQSYSDFQNINEIGVQKNQTINRNFATSSNTGCNSIACLPTRKEEQQWAQQAIKLEQKREINEVRPVPLTPPPSLSVGKEREASRVGSKRSKRVSFSCDIVSVDLLSASLPVQTDLSITTSEDEFNPNKPQAYNTVWSTIMDAYDSSITTQASIETPATKENSIPHYQVQGSNIYNDSENIQIQAGLVHNNSGILRLQTENIHYGSLNLQPQSKNFHNGAGVVSPSI